ncbi:MAG: hypothetical protein J5762_02625 [Clostridia bacterium]|nr:hypothetical protein [Clostridia bacterium]
MLPIKAYARLPFRFGTAGFITLKKIKGVFLRKQESGRDGTYTFTTEQALRETYVRPFEIAVKECGATAIMTSYGRIGAVWTGGIYAFDRTRQKRMGL